MEGPRPATAGEVEGAAALANRVFRLDAGLGPTMHREFPRLFRPEHPEQLWVMVDQGRVVSLVGTFCRKLLFPSGPLSTAAIGAVCTDPAYRGQGLAGRLLQRASLQLREQGVEVLIISGNRPLYQRIGAVRAGLVRWVTVPAGARGSDDKVGPTKTELVVEEVGPEQEESLAEVLHLYEQEPIHFERSRQDLQGFVAALPFGFDGTRYRRLWLARPGAGLAAVAYLTTDGVPVPHSAGPAGGSAVSVNGEDGRDAATADGRSSPPVYWQAREWGGDRRWVWPLATAIAAEYGIAGIRFPTPAWDSSWLTMAGEHGIDLAGIPGSSWGGTFVALAPEALITRFQTQLGDDLAGELLTALAAGRLTPPTLLALLFGQEHSWWAQGDWIEQLTELLGRRSPERAAVQRMAKPLPLPWVWGDTLNYV